jgi:hypothetical protein
MRRSAEIASRVPPYDRHAGIERGAIVRVVVEWLMP